MTSLDVWMTISPARRRVSRAIKLACWARINGGWVIWPRAQREHSTAQQSPVVSHVQRGSTQTKRARLRARSVQLEHTTPPLGELFAITAKMARINMRHRSPRAFNVLLEQHSVIGAGRPVICALLATISSTLAVQPALRAPQALYKVVGQRLLATPVMLDFTLEEALELNVSNAEQARIRPVEAQHASSAKQGHIKLLPANPAAIAAQRDTIRWRVG